MITKSAPVDTRRVCTRANTHGGQAESYTRCVWCWAPMRAHKTPEDVGLPPALRALCSRLWETSSPGTHPCPRVVSSSRPSSIFFPIFPARSSFVRVLVLWWTARWQLGSCAMQSTCCVCLSRAERRADGHSPICAHALPAFAVRPCLAPHRARLLSPPGRAGGRASVRQVLGRDDQGRGRRGRD